MLIKIANVDLKEAKVISPEIALSSNTSMEHFRQLTAQIKREYPKSDEFVYFVCRAIHAMEAANWDPITKAFSGDGHIARRGDDNKCVHCGERLDDWQDGLWHSKAGIDPYVNQNGDAFPEAELLKEVEVDGVKKKAFETFIGRGLFVNHASDDAEKIRGIVLDAQWDSGSKGVDILVACDKVAYPELARQIEMGYSNDVSMGTQVQYSLCSICGNRAITEADYCDHVKGGKGLARAGSKPVYEINNGLNFIEISVVSNGADPKAKIKTVLAALNRQVEERESKLNSCINPIEANRIRDELQTIRAQIEGLLGKDGEPEEVSIEACSTCGCGMPNVVHKKKSKGKKTDASHCGNPVPCPEEGLTKEDLVEILGGEVPAGVDLDRAMNTLNMLLGTSRAIEEAAEGSENPAEAIKETLIKRREARIRIAKNLGLSLSREEESDIALFEDNGTIIQGGSDMSKKKAYFQGGGGLNDPSVTPYDKEDYVNVRDNEDKQMVGQGMEPGNEGLHPGYDSHPVKPELRWKEELKRADLAKRREIRKAILQKAYFQGGGGLNDPEVTPYDKEDYTNVRDNEDKQMLGQGMEPGNEGLHPGYDSHPVKPELRWKEELHRAKLRAKFVTADAKQKSHWTLYAGDKPILTATAEELYGDDLDKPNEDNPEVTNWEWVASKDYGKNLIKAVKELGFHEVEAQISQAKGQVKTAQSMLPETETPPEPAPLPEDLGEGPMEELEGDEEKELSPKEEIEAKLGEIEDAIREIRSLNEGDEASVESLETELDLGEAGGELEDLGEKLEMAKSDEKLMKQLGIVVKDALKDADGILKKASAFSKPASPKIEKVAESKEEKAKEELDEAEENIEEAEDELGVQETPEEEAKEAKSSAARLLQRKAARYKLAAELANLYDLTDGDMIDEAHPGGGTDTKAGDEEKLEGDAHIETEKEQQDADMEVAEKQPRGEMTASNKAKKVTAKEDKKEDKDEKAKKDEKPDFADIDDDGNEEESAKEAAEDKKEKKEKKESSLEDRRKARHQAIAGLMSKAEVDGETKSYYSELFNESALGNPADPATKQFGKELTEEFETKKTTAEAHQLKERMKRAYRVASRQQKLGQIGETAEDLELQVDKLLNMDTAGFEAFEDVIENTEIVKDAKVNKPMKKSAGAVRVGLVHPDQDSLTDQLSKLDWS